MARPAATWHDGQIAHASHAIHGWLEALSKAVGGDRRQICPVAIYVRFGGMADMARLAGGPTPS